MQFRDLKSLEICERIGNPLIQGIQFIKVESSKGLNAINLNIMCTVWIDWADEIKIVGKLVAVDTQKEQLYQFFCPKCLENWIKVMTEYDFAMFNRQNGNTECICAQCSTKD